MMKKQGVFNFNLGFNVDKDKKGSIDTSKMKSIIFVGKPKRIFKTNSNFEETTLQDPKRVHQALREFNDISANKVFKQMMVQIAAMEKDNTVRTDVLDFDSNPNEVI